MREKLGVILLRGGLVLEKDLDEALQRQVIFGGRLGTNLVELGVVSEEALLKALSEQQHVPYAEPHLFENLPRHVVEAVPQDLVERHGVVPINKEKNRIILAMMEPTRLDVIDEVAFRTACIVKPVVATELRLTQALERYYGIRRDLRYLAVPGSGPRKEEGPMVIETGPATMPGFAGFGGRPTHRGDAAPQELVVQPPPMVASPGSAPAGGGIVTHSIPGPAAAPPPPVPLSPAPPPLSATPAPPAEDRLSLEWVNLRLLGARDRNEVAAVLVEAGLRAADGILLFILKGEEANGWDAGGMAKMPEGSPWKVKLEKHSVLTLLGDSKTMFRGAGKDLLQTNPWLAPAVPAVPQDVVAVPLLLKGRAMAALMAFGGARQLNQEEVEFLLRLMRKATVTFEVLILQTKLVSA